MQTKFHHTLLVLIITLILMFAASCQAQETPAVVQEHPAQQAPATPEPTEALPAMPTETPPALPTETPIPDADQARAAITQGLLALNNRPNRMTVTTTLEDGTTSTNIIEYVPPDRKRIISPDVDVEYVIIGEAVYMKLNGNWTSVQIPAATFMGEPVSEANISATTSEPRFLRLDELDGMPVVVYGYQSTTLSNGLDLNSQVELLVGVADGLVYQIITDGETLSVSTDANGQSISLAVPTLSTTHIEYDDTIRIDPPIQ